MATTPKRPQLECWNDLDDQVTTAADYFWRELLKPRPARIAVAFWDGGIIPEVWGIETEEDQRSFDGWRARNGRHSAVGLFTKPKYVKNKEETAVSMLKFANGVLEIYAEVLSKRPVVARFIKRRAKTIKHRVSWDSWGGGTEVIDALDRQWQRDNVSSMSDSHHVPIWRNQGEHQW